MSKDFKIFAGIQIVLILLVMGTMDGIIRGQMQRIEVQINDMNYNVKKEIEVQFSKQEARLNLLSKVLEQGAK